MKKFLQKVLSLCIAISIITVGMAATAEAVEDYSVVYENGVNYYQLNMDKYGTEKIWLDETTPASTVSPHWIKDATNNYPFIGNMRDYMIMGFTEVRFAGLVKSDMDSELSANYTTLEGKSLYKTGNFKTSLFQRFNWGSYSPASDTHLEISLPEGVSYDAVRIAWIDGYEKYKADGSQSTVTFNCNSVSKAVNTKTLEKARNLSAWTQSERKWSETLSNQWQNAFRIIDTEIEVASTGGMIEVTGNGVDASAHIIAVTLVDYTPKYFLNQNISEKMSDLSVVPSNLSQTKDIIFEIRKYMKDNDLTETDISSTNLTLLKSVEEAAVALQKGSVVDISTSALSKYLVSASDIGKKLYWENINGSWVRNDTNFYNELTNPTGIKLHDYMGEINLKLGNVAIDEAALNEIIGNDRMYYSTSGTGYSFGNSAITIRQNDGNWYDTNECKTATVPISGKYSKISLAATAPFGPSDIATLPVKINYTDGSYDSCMLTLPSGISNPVGKDGYNFLFTVGTKTGTFQQQTFANNGQIGIYEYEIPCFAAKEVSSITLEANTSAQEIKIFAITAEPVENEPDYTTISETDKTYYQLNMNKFGTEKIWVDEINPTSTSSPNWINDSANNYPFVGNSRDFMILGYNNIQFAGTKKSLVDAQLATYTTKQNSLIYKTGAGKIGYFQRINWAGYSPSSDASVSIKIPSDISYDEIRIAWIDSATKFKTDGTQGTVSFAAGGESVDVNTHELSAVRNIDSWSNGGKFGLRLQAINSANLRVIDTSLLVSSTGGTLTISGNGIDSAAQIVALTFVKNNASTAPSFEISGNTVSVNKNDLAPGDSIIIASYNQNKLIEVKMLTSADFEEGITDVILTNGNYTKVMGFVMNPSTIKPAYAPTPIQ